MTLPPADPERLPPAYVRGAPAPHIDLWLDGNEGPPLADAFAAAVARELAAPERWRRYPDERALRVALARRFGVDAEAVVLGAGADELLDRICRAWLARGRALAAPVPCFPMLPRYVQLAGARFVPVPWLDGPLPAAALAAAAADVVAITTPNNPTGLAADKELVLALVRAQPERLFVIDLAYAEFAAVDPTAQLLALPNVLVVRTFSKARGLAGLRVGYALGAAETIAVLRATGSPYPCSALSLWLCERALAGDDPAPRIAAVRRERAALAALLARHGLTVAPSEANFVFARAADPAAARGLGAALAAAGIAVRTFDPADPLLAAAVRITCPGDDGAFARLAAALADCLPKPEPRA